jgi:beta-1,4-mannosyl-glycoprotein beta-1,4-N-acetylglucosaminyltransferase
MFNKWIVSFFALCTLSTAHSKIYDCFLFCDEFELLQIRLEELFDQVDYFVLMEAGETFQGEKKNYNFSQYKKYFEKYISKIIRVPMTELRPYMTPWERESYQRNTLGWGLIDCHWDDIVLISDVDEIPKREVISQIKQKLQAGAVGVALQQQCYYYQLNRQPFFHSSLDPQFCIGTVATTFRHIFDTSPDDVRTQGLSGEFELIPNGGWHFRFVGGLESLRYKMRNLAYGVNDVSYLTPEVYYSLLEEYSIMPIDDTFPHFVKNNVDHYKALQFIAELKPVEPILHALSD